MYKDYCKEKSFTKPDIILGFNLGIVAYPSWRSSILEIPKLNCPFVLTAFSEREANDDKESMQTIFDTNKKVEKNPFASLRPKRSPIGDKIFYDNQFIMIYTDLFPNDLTNVEQDYSSDVDKYK